MEVLVEDAIVREVSYGESIKVVGELVPGAFAGLLVVDGDPYRDLGVFRSDGCRLDVIMANG